MPLLEPSLDTRTFDQLVAESRREVPGLAPGWTDHNASDPGITLIELVSWLVEQDLYRLDRVPDDVVRTFLHLLGCPPRPPAVARTIVSLAWRGAGTSTTLPAGLQLAQAATGIRFEMPRSVTVSRADLVAVLSWRPGAVVDRTAESANADRDWMPLGESPEIGDALYLGFDRALGDPGDLVSLAFWREDPEADARTWAAIMAEWRSSRRVRHPGCVVVGMRGHPDVTLTWEYLDSAGTWSALPAAKDTTRSLSLSGWLRFRIPSDHAAGGPLPGLFCVRARVSRGRYACAPRLRGIRSNAALLAHAALVDRPEDLGPSRGHALETASLDGWPVVAGSTALAWTRGIEIERGWTDVPDWTQSGPGDRHVRLVPDTGRLDFGDGLRGRVPRAGWNAVVSYRIGGGPGGNIPAGTLIDLPSSINNQALVADLTGLRQDLSIEHPIAGFGGHAAESTDDATARVIARLEDPDKAVTVADFERLARLVPGVEIARARAVSSYDPLLACVPAAGLVTVIVVPRCPGPRPTATPGLLGAVAAYLDRRRMVTAEIKVIGPCYEEVSVDAILDVATGSDPDSLRSAAEAAIAAYLHPLSGGPDSTGWPIGRPVYLTEVIALLSDLPGVDAVTDAGLLGPGDETPRCSNFELCPECLPASGTHRIHVATRPAVRVPDRSESDEC